jgi:uncharacterized protein with von Willebrand factor type A (vWA) domain
MPGGRLAGNVVRFGRVLRAAGLPAGPARVLDALRAIEAVGFERREDFHAALSAVFVERREQQAVFDQAFDVFWRNPQLLERMMQLLLPQVHGRTPANREQPASPRVMDALLPARNEAAAPDARERIELDAAQTFSAREQLRAADFEAMTAEEWRAARRMLAGLRLPLRELPTRRARPDAAGSRIDFRATLRAMQRGHPDTIVLRRRAPGRRPPALVVLCDISGSMSRYSRMFLHFLHAIMSDRQRVSAFVFGTALTDITRCLRHRDVDVAVASAAKTALDWSGGTRIGACLAAFNRRWARRLLGQGAVVLLVTDGLDRDAADGVAAAMERLHKSCRRLIWLNPLLRYEGFEAKPAGIRAMLPHVDDFLPVHNLASLEALGQALSSLPPFPAPPRAHALATDTGMAAPGSGQPHALRPQPAMARHPPFPPRFPRMEPH